jgi:hypothetical protein
MPIFLEKYTIPFDLPERDLLYALRRVSRGTAVRMLWCGFRLNTGAVWCLTEAPNETAIRRGMGQVDFAFTLDTVEPLDGVFDPSSTPPAGIGTDRFPTE